MRRTILIPALVVLAQLGCGHGSGGSDSSSTTTTTTPPATTQPVGFVVTAYSPQSAPAASTPAIAVSFSEPVDVATLIDGTTLTFVEDDDTTPGGNYHVLAGTINFDPTGTNATFTPANGFTIAHEVRFAFTSGVRSTTGEALDAGNASAALSLQGLFADQVFEGRFLPTTTPPPSTTTTGSTPTGSTPTKPTTPGSTATGAISGTIPPPTAPPSTPPPGPSVAGAFEIVRTTPTNGSKEPVPTTIYIEFSNVVDTSTLTGGSGGSLVVLQTTKSSSTMNFPSFKIRWENNNTRLAIVPQPLFTPGPDMIVLFGSTLKDATGKSLTKGAVSATVTQKTWLQSAVFQLQFTPSPVPTPAIGGDPSLYQLQAGTDPWFIDFDLRASTFAQDMSSHGLLSGDATTDSLAKARIEATVLATLSEKYGRTPDGKGQTGAWKVSFTSSKPSGTAGKDYSREAVGGFPPSQGTLGISNMDSGNQSADDNSKSGYGIFAAAISGVDSKLSPPLTAADKKFLDGSYTLGAGSSSDDARFVRVHSVIDDWGRALGSVTSHECGHSVGLNHYDAQLSIMSTASTDSQLSEPRTYFYPPSAQLLDQNLGKQ